MLVQIFTNRALRRKMRRLAAKNATDSAIPWAWFPTEEKDQHVDQDEAEAMLIDLAEEEEEDE
jgi:pyrroloquinoline quinone (PQQ) biosynthesis protein C